MGGWVESERYTCVRLYVNNRYMVGGWVKNGRFWRYVIMQWPLSIFYHQKYVGLCGFILHHIRHHSGPRCIKIVCGWGSAPDPAGGAYSTPTDPLAGFEGKVRREISRGGRGGGRSRGEETKGWGEERGEERRGEEGEEGRRWERRGEYFEYAWLLLWVSWFIFNVTSKNLK